MLWWRSEADEAGGVRRAHLIASAREETLRISENHRHDLWYLPCSVFLRAGVPREVSPIHSSPYKFFKHDWSVAGPPIAQVKLTFRILFVASSRVYAGIYFVETSESRVPQDFGGADGSMILCGNRS